jgi:dephospho-CoA kinase
VIVAGLTGGIATGKSTVSAIFAEAGAMVVDADRIAHEAVRKGSDAWGKIVAQFGRQVLRPDGEIDRGCLAEIIFNDTGRKEALNRIVHPYVRAETARQLEAIERRHPEAVVILDVPLLLEAHMDEGMAEIIVVYAPEAIQLQRLMERDRLTEAQARARIRSQMPIEEKKSRATIVIDNSGTLAAVRDRTLAVLGRLRRRASSGVAKRTP